jgi:hypothetical protein
MESDERAYTCALTGEVTVAAKLCSVCVCPSIQSVISYELL